VSLSKNTLLDMLPVDSANNGSYCTSGNSIDRCYRLLSAASIGVLFSNLSYIFFRQSGPWVTGTTTSGSVIVSITLVLLFCSPRKVLKSIVGFIVCSYMPTFHAVFRQATKGNQHKPMDEPVVALAIPVELNEQVSVAMRRCFDLLPRLADSILSPTRFTTRSVPAGPHSSVITNPIAWKSFDRLILCHSSILEAEWHLC